MTSPWRIELLGGLRARRGEVVVERFRTRKTGALLAFLAYQNRSQARETLIEEIWPSCELETGRNNLRLALAALRRVLENDNEADVVVRADRSLVTLHHIETDVSELEDVLRQVATNSERVPLLERALQLYQGPLLKGYYENWIPPATARLEALMCAALETLINDLQAQGEWARARQWVHRGAERGLTVELHTNAPVRTVTEKTTGAAPIFLSRFFGRENELEQLVSHLSAQQSSPWLLTLTGPGGAGKTRLASEALARSATPAIWIALEGLTDAARLDEALIAALDVAVPPARAPFDCAVEVLQEGTPLLCFDNFEHLLPAGADWLIQLKERVPTLRVLTTSRARLELDGEVLLEVGALELPISEAPDDVAQSAAAALFLDRARAVNPNFSLLQTDEAQFTRLLRQLDGLPLALELAAARAGILSPAQMLKRLQNDADLPPLARRRAPRHHSLGATLSWSLELLDDAQRALLANLSVFHAPFNLEAAQAVVAPDDNTIILEQLAGLRDASLIRVAPPPTDSQSQWFTVLETVRVGARRLLTPDQNADLARRHALHFVNLAERAEADVHCKAGWNARLNAVWLDLSAALHWTVRARETVLGLRLASALWKFWVLGGRAREGFTHLEELLKLLEASKEIGHELRLQTRAATVTGFLALQRGDYAAAEKYLERASEMAGDTATTRDILAWALNLRGTVAQRLGDCDTACQHFARSLELYAEAPPHQRAVSLTALAGALVCDGQIETAQPYIWEARVLWRTLEDEPGMGWLAEIEGRAALQTGDLVLARALLEASWRARAATRNGTINALDALGELEQREGRYGHARAHYQTMLAAARELGLRPFIASALMGIGYAARALNEIETARQNWQQALVLWNEIGDEKQKHCCGKALRSLHHAT